MTEIKRFSNLNEEQITALLASIRNRDRSVASLCVFFDLLEIIRSSEVTDIAGVAMTEIIPDNLLREVTGLMISLVVGLKENSEVIVESILSTIENNEDTEITKDHLFSIIINSAINSNQAGEVSDEENGDDS